MNEKNMFAFAEDIRSLINEGGLTQEETAKYLCVSQSYIANKLRLLKLTKSERDIICKYHLTERHVRALLQIKDKDKRMNAIKYTAENHLTVGMTEEYVSGKKEDEP